MYYGGHIAYYVEKLDSGFWILDSLYKRAELDGVTQEDIDQELLNDDQWQAIDGMTFEEAQNEVYWQIVAIFTDAPNNAIIEYTSAALYEEVCRAGSPRITEPD